jgi:hypothetical protein
MPIDSGRLKHLEILQQVITRMATNSFLVKGWSVTLLSAIFAIAASKDGLHQIVWVGFLPLVMFWMLDGFFLRQERLYRKLWEGVCAQAQDTPTDFNMDTSAVAAEVQSWLQVSLSQTLGLFHGALAIVLIIVFILVNYR